MAFSTPGVQGKAFGARKKKKTIVSGGVDAEPSTPRKTAVQKFTSDFYTKEPLGTGSKTTGRTFTETNKTKNVRAGKKFRTELTASGEIHVYKNGERVFVKKKKKNANPSRFYH